jgi:hypothetical protein
LKRGSRSSLIVNSECAAVDDAGDIAGVYFDFSIYSDVDTITEFEGSILGIELVLSDGWGGSGGNSHDKPQNLIK